MTAEEKQVIDEFQGESNYNKVMADTGYYLITDGQQLLLNAG